MSTLTWLHLSDLHFRTGEQHTWEENIVLRALLNDIREAVISEDLHPDFVAVSGDIAFSGKAEEYALAQAFLAELLTVTQVSKDCLLIVPGNHDVQRETISQGAKGIASSLNSRSALDQVLTDHDDRRLMLRRFRHYADFVNNYLSTHLTFDDEDYFYVKPFNLGIGRVAVLGLNSAWLSAGDNDYGNLALGERQVRQALEASRDADLRIALLHHPFDWLLEFDRNDCEALLMQGCRFILHGHLHRAGLLGLLTPDAGATVIAAGSCYETRQYPNGYNWVQFDLDSGQGTVHLRTYSDRRGGFWTRDNLTYRNVTNGEFTFTLPTPQAKTIVLKGQVQASPITTAKLEASYLRRLQRVCSALPLAIIDPRAVERTRQQTMDLMAVYVDLDTQTRVPVKEDVQDQKKHSRRGAPMGPERETRPLSALEAVARARQMVLLGDPGSGKSTFANYLALCLSGARLERLGETGMLPGEKWLTHLEPAWTHGALLPLQIILRHFAKSDHCNGTAAGLWNFITQTLDAQGLADLAPYLRQQLHDGGVLVVLDGLDEVAGPDKWQAVRNAVSDFVTTFAHPANRFLVTCRGYAYQDTRWQLNDFAALTLAPFRQEQIDAFINSWYREACRLGWKNEGEAGELTRRLQEATHRADLEPLARNPLQLAMMASLHFSWGRLPEDRVRLYQEMVRLLLVRWQEARLGEETGVTQTVSEDKLESALEQVAFVAHQTQESAAGPADISEETLRSVFKDYLEGSWDRAGEMVAYIQDRAGLLIDRGKGTFTFPHRSYQEYLAGSYLAVQPDFPDKAAALVRDNYAQWREVILWAVGVMARLKKMTYVAVDVAAALCPSESPGQGVSENDWHASFLAGEALLEIGLEAVKVRERYLQLLNRVQKWLTALIERGVLTTVDRAAAGRVLAYLGDPRPDVSCPIPTLVDVPAGEFAMGSRESRYEDEKPQHRVTLPEFRIGRYPVTNEQYRRFVDDGGYTDRHRDCWTDAGWKWREQNQIAKPEFWDGAEWNLGNHPVVGVSWFEAVAYCNWLAKTDPQGRKFRLPTEAEWEKAARGTDGREYPWLGEFDAKNANTMESEIGRTTAVGLFPRGESPCHAFDLAGNVWEWCSSLGYEQNRYKARGSEEDGSDSLEGDQARALRGGSWPDFQDLARCAYRYWHFPVSRFSYIGFRVVES